MATAKKTTTEAKLTPAQLKRENERLKEEIEKIKKSSRCQCCDTLKDKEKKFYVSTDPNNKTGVTPICIECSRKIALRVDKNGEEHEILVCHKKTLDFQTYRSTF